MAIPAATILMANFTHIDAATTAAASAPSHGARSATIQVNGHVFASNVPFVVSHGTAYVPLATAIHAMQAMGANVVYANDELLIDNLSYESRTLYAQPADTIAIANGAYVNSSVPIKSVAVDGKMQTYVPIWYINQALTQGNTGYMTSWKHSEWSLDNDAMGPPSEAEIEQVMASASEANDTGEHFALGGTPVTVRASNGDSITAAVGMRSPTADGYGQVVFLFHNQQFVGLDSNVEKSQIESIQPLASGMGFRVKYANYAPSDPMVAPSLPPVTVDYTWDGSTFNSSAEIPTGAELGNVRVNVGAVSAASVSAQDSVPAIAKTTVAKALPKGAVLITPPGASSPYVPVDFDGNGQFAYACAYRGPSGLECIVVGLKGDQWGTLWQGKSEGSQLRVLDAGDMTGDATNELVFAAYVGDGADDVYVLKDLKSGVKTVYHGLGMVDIGDFNGLGQMEIAQWSHDTGPIENIQIYAWNSAKQTYSPATNADFPLYFGNVSLAYDTAEELSSIAKGAPKMIDDLLAATYEDMGDYAKAATTANAALQLPAQDYPGNATFQAIAKTSNQDENGVKTYQQLPASVKQNVDAVINQYSGFVTALAEATPMVSLDSSGTYLVNVIGAFHSSDPNSFKTAVELSFSVDASGLVQGSLVAKDSFGQTVWTD